ncbi:hypothetical protein EI94DRAFT_1812274 [Lactarius quietus]|nr:hypothetical protein EI94DRAFT_1812274 [Lactarius quietus]
MQVKAPCEDDFVFDELRDAQPSNQLPYNDLIVEKAHLHSHSPSSETSFSSSSQPQSLPVSDDDSESGIADDAEERLSMEHNHLSGKPLCPEVLKSCYLRSMTESTTVDSIACIVPTTSVPRFIKPSTSAQVVQMWLKKGDIRLTDLPSHLQSRFINEVTPHIFKLFEIINAWEQPSLADLQKIWRDVFPEEHILSLQMTEAVIDDCLLQWRKRFEEHTFEALEEITFNDLPTNDIAVIAHWNDVYNELEGSPPIIKGIFQSPLIAVVLEMHMSWLSAIDKDICSDKKPVGALVHAIQVAKCAIMWWETGIMVKPQKPLNKYPKVNWGDHIETWEGCTICINMALYLVAVISQLKEKQQDKILKAVQASGKVKKWMMHMVSDTPEPSEATLVELRDDNSDLMDEE